MARRLKNRAITTALAKTVRTPKEAVRNNVRFVFRDDAIGTLVGSAKE